MKRGFTLIELLIVIVIAGILVTIAVPNFTKMIDKTRQDQAITYLKVIRTGEMIYYSSHSTYIVCADKGEIKENLGAEVTEEAYTFKVEAGATHDIATSFYAKASKALPDGGSFTISIDQNGNITESMLGWPGPVRPPLPPPR